MDKASQNKDFLQSKEWRKFQEAGGKKTYIISSPQPSPFSAGGEDFDFWASIIEHKLPLVGMYFYIPRGPIIKTKNEKLKTQNSILEVIDLAKREKAGWIRFDASDSHALALVRSNWRVVKAPHDMQPKEVFIIDIMKPEAELLAEMNSKTRYNVRLAEKKGVSVKVADNQQLTTSNYLEEFLRLVKVTSKRQGITAHPENYYRKMFEVIPGKNIRMYVAEYENKVIAANVVVFYDGVATYLHGASDNEYRSVMAPYLLQWRANQVAKKAGMKAYDFGGVSSGPTPLNLNDQKGSDRYGGWAGITKFKTGFSPSTKPTEFLGSYDIVLNNFKYNLYRILQKIKSFM